MRRVVVIYLVFALLYFAAFVIAAWFSDWGTGATPAPGAEDLVAVIDALAK